MRQTDDAAVAAADPTTVGQAVQTAEAVNPMTSGFGEFVKRVSEGDLSADTWILFWDSVGQRLLLALVLIVAVVVASRWLKILVTKACARGRVEQTLARFLSTATGYIVLIAGGVAILGTLGLEMASFAAVLAAVGFAIGMAFSGTLGNVAAGIMLLFFRPFRVGDFVEVSGVSGTVWQIHLFNTELDTTDNRRLIVPNSEVFNNTIENTSLHPTRRADVTVGIDYGADLAQTRAVLEKVAASVVGSLQDPAPQVALTELAGSSVNWDVRVWANKSDFWDVKERLIHDIKTALDGAGIGIPYPTMDVRVDAMVRRPARNGRG